MPKNNDLLIRIDERISHIKNEMIKHDAHFSKIYDKLEKQGKYIERLKVKVAIGAAIVGSTFAIIVSYFEKMKFW